MPRAGDEGGDPPDGPPDGARRQAPDLGDVAVEGRAVDGKVIELLLEELRRHAVEEQVDRENDHDEVVEATEDGQAVRHEIAPGMRRIALRTGPGVKRRICAMSRSKAARSMPSSALRSVGIRSSRTSAVTSRA